MNILSCKKFPKECEYLTTVNRAYNAASLRVTESDCVVLITDVSEHENGLPVYAVLIRFHGGRIKGNIMFGIYEDFIFVPAKNYIGQTYDVIVSDALFQIQTKWNEAMAVRSYM